MLPLVSRALHTSECLGVAEAGIVSWLLCCGVGIDQCLFNLLYYTLLQHPSLKINQSLKATYSASLATKPRPQGFSDAANLSDVYPAVSSDVRIILDIAKRLPNLFSASWI